MYKLNKPYQSESFNDAIDRVNESMPFDKNKNNSNRR
jgi:hypothetical protein